MKILNTPEKEEKIGYIIFCRSCKDRYTQTMKQTKCRKCDHETEIAGPLWIGKLFEKEFVKKQTSAWTLENIQKLIYKINNIELLSKKNNIDSLFIVSDFILESAQ